MLDYNATIEVAHRPGSAGPDPDLADTILDKLASASPTISTGARGWLEVTITLPATSLIEATTTAIGYVKLATGHEPVSVAVTTTAEYDKRNGLDVPMPDLISVTEAAEILGVSRSAVIDRITRHTLPATKVGREYVIRRASLAGATQ